MFGEHVAFHVRQTGTYIDGLGADLPPHQSALLHCNGLVRIVEGEVVSGRIIRDRAGLRAKLKAARQ